MPSARPLFRGAFPAGEDDEFSREGKRPVIFDILGPDKQTSLLPEGYKMVLFVNPSSLGLSYERSVERIQTRGGFVEQHWGDGARSMSIEASTGGFMRLYTGLSNVTSPVATGGSRRETLAYDSYLDMLALFHNNGSVYDTEGRVALQGIIKVTFDGGVYRGWFSSFSVTESAENPYRFTMSASMDLQDEVQVWKTVLSFGNSATESSRSDTLLGDTQLQFGGNAAAAAATNSPDAGG
jgi:hypothetical protein